MLSTALAPPRSMNKTVPTRGRYTFVLALLGSQRWRARSPGRRRAKVRGRFWCSGGGSGLCELAVRRQRRQHGQTTAFVAGGPSAFALIGLKQRALTCGLQGHLGFFGPESVLSVRMGVCSHDRRGHHCDDQRDDQGRSDKAGQRRVHGGADATQATQGFEPETGAEPADLFTVGGASASSVSSTSAASA